MKKWTGTVEVTTLSRHICTVVASTQEDAERALRGYPSGLNSLHPCGCGCNIDNGKVSKVHSVRLISSSGDD